eukprot:CAMPEP_0196642264 /NCGR_PEP_ID=MMETSP1085-20130531/4497_1 /TAXON_ID=41879 ORGANISM="Pycnococcus sp, Strain CCMP1998" /NCGR_SAMPLE_ID=MMETSP1085 /ASSEMBLY_ACC=CAM_ASM_000807 /LENGTH=549 /DNA_ID=CAMNT_0041971601 /DNA_START=92 /DNA_END=1743 /DNA_ORIENTATION=+
MKRELYASGADFPSYSVAREVDLRLQHALALLHHLHELVKGDVGVVWARAGLRVVLDCQDVQLLGDHAGDCAVVEVDVGDLHAVREGSGVHCKVVVLGADLDGIGQGVLDRVVPAVVAELELEGRPAKGLAQDLVPHADPKARQLSDDVLRIVHGVRGRARVSRSVAEEHSVRLHLQHLLPRVVRRHHGHVAPSGGEPLQDVALDPKVVRDDLEIAGLGGRHCVRPAANDGLELPLLLSLVPPLVGLLASDLLEQVLAQDAPRRRHLRELRVRLARIGADHPDQRPGVPELPSELPSVDTGDSHDLLPLQVLVQGLHGPVVAHRLREVPAHHAAQVAALLALHVALVDADVANVGLGEAHHLAVVRRVRQDLLVPRERGIENDLGEVDLGGGVAKRIAGKDGAILQHEPGVVLPPGLARGAGVRARARAPPAGDQDGAGGMGDSAGASKVPLPLLLGPKPALAFGATPRATAAPHRPSAIGRTLIALIAPACQPPRPSLTNPVLIPSHHTTDRCRARGRPMRDREGCAASVRPSVQAATRALRVASAGP